MMLHTDFSTAARRMIDDRGGASSPAREMLQALNDAREALETNPGEMRQIALNLFTRISSSDRTPLEPARGGLAPWQKRRVQRYLAENMVHSIRMSELAGEVRLSVSHFCRAFKMSFGETSHAHLQRLRLEMAKKLMLTTGDPLSQIALDCGLADQAHLSKLFRRALHDTPNAWRRRNLTDAQAPACRGRTRLDADPPLV